MQKVSLLNFFSISMICFRVGLDIYFRVDTYLIDIYKDLAKCSLLFQLCVKVSEAKNNFVQRIIIIYYYDIIYDLSL